MLEYKSAWKGVALVPLTKSETYGSSRRCSACGESLRIPEEGDTEHRRMVWCRACKKWKDRDVNAAIVLSERGLARFVSSLPQPGSRIPKVRQLTGDEGEAVEAMKRNGTKIPIPRVDASKLGHGHRPPT